MLSKNAIFKRMSGYQMKGRLETDVLMSGETSFRIGGPADIFFVPDNVAEAVRVVRLCRREGISLTVLGNGTNVLVRDGGIRGIVMKLGGFSELRRERGSIFAGAGAPLAGVCRFARDESLSGLEFACGIPGSVGGAVCMNAGAYGCEIKDVVYRSVIMERDGNIGLIDNAGHGFAYRYSMFQTNGSVVLETEFRLMDSKQGEIAAKMDGYNASRNASQPLDMPSAGSVFRRPPGDGVYVGPMIEECGLKGAFVGGARVSDKHAGFIVNTGGASAADVLELIDRIKNEVRRRFSLELVTEIRVIGEE